MRQLNLIVWTVVVVVVVVVVVFLLSWWLSSLWHPKESLMVFLSTCWLVLSLGQCSRCSSSMPEFGIWHVVHSLDTYVPVFLK